MSSVSKSIDEKESENKKFKDRTKTPKQTTGYSNFQNPFKMKTPKKSDEANFLSTAQDAPLSTSINFFQKTAKNYQSGIKKRHKILLANFNQAFNYSSRKETQTGTPKSSSQSSTRKNLQISTGTQNEYFIRPPLHPEGASLYYQDQKKNNEKSSGFAPLSLGFKKNTESSSDPRQRANFDLLKSSKTKNQNSNSKNNESE